MWKLESVYELKRCDFYLDGWKTYLTIKYGLTKIANKTYLLWNVEGTEHIFNIDLLVVYGNHGGNYEEHFKMTLKKFREDLIDWYKKGLPEQYMKKYWKQFNKFILL